MAENNSSAPLKTAPMIEAFEAAYSRDWNDPAGDEIKEIWHRAWQAAVAAQAAPGAVAVPEITDAMVDAYLAEQRRTVEEADRFGRSSIGGLHTNTVREGCSNGLRAALAATPSRPVTEDSSAGDQVEAPAGSGGWKVHAESLEKECSYWKTLAETMRAHQNKDVWYWQGDGSDNPASMVNSLAVVIRADDLRDLMAKPQAEVQAEPLKRVYLVNTGEVRNGLELYERHDHPVPLAEYETLYTAPQAQPADALDAARLMFLMDETDGFVIVEKDKYDFAIECAGEAGREVPTEADELNGLRRLIDAAMAAAQEGGKA